MWFTAENGLWSWHTRMGVVLFGVLVFRVMWGVVGSRTARFAQFVKGPSAVMAYLRGEETGRLGHSPIAALSVIALLAAMSVQVGMGLFAGDPFDGATGPLNHLIGVATADILTEWHEVFYWVVLGLVALHLAAIAFYLVVKRDNLVTPMLTGYRRTDNAVEGNTAVNPIVAVAILGLSASITVWVWLGAPPLA
jgi:cytochrome b